MSTNHQPEDKIPEVVAGLEMLTVTSANISSVQTKRVLRKRIQKAPIIKSEVLLNRRCSQRPKKRTYSEMESEDDARAYYLDKSVKRSPHTLETIYEEDEKVAIDSTSQPQMSTKRFKRMINFQTKPSNVKQKKRRLKIKKAFGSKLFMPRRIELKDVLKRLELIRSTSPPDVEHEE